MKATKQPQPQLTAPTRIPTPSETGLVVWGKMIAVLDEGFVYVGDVYQDGNFYLISGAKNIRRWGTTKGLGELRTGPTKETVCDEAGELIVPAGRVVHFLKCTGW